MRPRQVEELSLVLLAHDEFGEQGVRTVLIRKIESEVIKPVLQCSEPEARTGSASLRVVQGLSGMLEPQAEDAGGMGILPLNRVATSIRARSKFGTYRRMHGLIEGNI